MATVAEGRILIRRMTEADLKQVRRIERAAYGSSLPGTPFERELRNGLAEYLVAIEAPTASDVPAEDHRSLFDALRRLFSHDPEERVLGFLGVWYTVDQLHVVTVAVDPAEQGRGIAQRLLLECHRLAADAELATIALEVRVSNARAQRLYEWLGFNRAGTLRRYYSDNGEDALVMLTPRLDDAAFEVHVSALRARLLDRFGDWRAASEG
jgi:ribosomal-protein-alanine N-acetyltransferase